MKLKVKFLNKTNVFMFTLLSLTVLCIAGVAPALAVSEDTWTSKAPLPTEREGFGVAVVNGKIYIIGGYPGIGSLFSNENQMYDPGSNSWIALAPMPTARVNFGIAVYQNKIYVIGGQDTAHAIPGPNFIDYHMEGLTGANEIYNPATDTWETKAPMPTPRNYLQANVVNGKIYLIGGQSQQRLEYPPTEHTSNLTEVYDPATDSWTTMTPIPTTVYGYASAVMNNKIYAMSGWSVKTPLSDQVQIFDPKSNTWTTGTPIPIPVTLAGAGATTGAMAPKRIYVIGGCPAANTQAQSGISANQVYDPATDTWSSGAEMPTARYGLALAVANDKLYVMGGGSISLTNSNEQYTPIGYGTPDPAYETPSPSLSPSPSATPSTSPSPPPSNQGPSLPRETIYAAVAGAAAIAITAAVYLKKRK